MIRKSKKLRMEVNSKKVKTMEQFPIKQKKEQIKMMDMKTKKKKAKM